MMLLTSFALLFLAQTAAPPVALSTPTAKKICRRETATGSIMVKTHCRTRAEWTQIDAATAGAAEQAMRQRNPRVGTSSLKD
jgi:hypothetical protein